MAKDLKKGDAVRWTWGRGEGTGTVQEKFTDRVKRTIKGTQVTRNASKDEPAYLVEGDGGRALKSGSELKKGRGKKKKR